MKDHTHPIVVQIRDLSSVLELQYVGTCEAFSQVSQLATFAVCFVLAGQTARCQALWVSASDYFRFRKSRFRPSAAANQGIRRQLKMEWIVNLLLTA